MFPFRLQDLICLAALGLAAALTLGPYWGGGAVPVDLSYAQTLEPWSAAGDAPDAGALSRLHTYETYPTFQHLSGEGGKVAHMLWNEDDGLGAPVLARWRTRALSPFTVPFYLMPLETAWAWSLWLKLAVAAITAYYTARRFGLVPNMAAVVGAAYAFSAPVYLWSSEPLGDAAPWFPLLLLSAERAALGQPNTWPLAAVTLALMGLGGNPPVLAGAVATYLGYLLLRRWISGAGSGLVHLGLLSALAVAASAGLLAVQIWPYFEYLGQSAETGAFADAAPRYAWQGLISPLLPAGAAPSAGLWAGLLFLGPCAFLLLPVWYVIRGYMEPPLRSRTDALAAGAGLATALTLVSTLVLPASYAPQWVSPMALCLITPFALGYLVAAVSEEWLLLSADEIREVIRRLRVNLMIWWGGWLLLTIVFSFQDTPLMARALLVAFGTIAALFLLFGYTLLKPNATLLGYGTAALTMVTLVLSLGPLQPRTASDKVFPATEYSEALQRSVQERVSGSGTLARWPLSIYGLNQLPSPNAADLTRVALYEERLSQDPMLVRDTGAEALLLSKEDIQGPMAPLRPLLRIEEVFSQGAVLFRDTELRARARVIFQGKRATWDDLQTISASTPSFIEGATLPEDGPTEVLEANVTELSPIALTVQVPDTQPGILVLADTWYPGWRAYVGDVLMNVLPIDAVFRGVELGEGEHTVEFRYEPTSFKYGLWISCFTLVAIAVAGIRARRSRNS
ncbi:MAG: hypothetical protein GC168_02050 [Candidatus Hydrogenedens sp.]|nr:hypothetical protein [Candidatus Hydrogenedens sp.]